MAELFIMTPLSPLKGSFNPFWEPDDYGISPDQIKTMVNDSELAMQSINNVMLEHAGNHAINVVDPVVLSTMLGEFVRASLVKQSDGALMANGSGQFPDIIKADGSKTGGIEIKVALETHKPKGHLPKPGTYLTVRYVLTSENNKDMAGTYVRGETVRIWEVRLGRLVERHFNISSTDGDSGKTATINKAGMEALMPVYWVPQIAPVTKSGSTYRDIDLSMRQADLFGTGN